MARIFLSPPDVGAAEVLAAERAILSGWVAPIGEEIDHFEQEIGSYVGAANVLALNSGTAALHLGLLANGVAEGSYVITSTMTFIATVNAIRYVGAVPVFVDTNLDGLMNLDQVVTVLQKLRREGREVGAILPVDLYGKSSNVDALMKISKEMDVPVLFDSAEALGSKFGDRRVGSFGDTIFSFNGNKIMTTSAGGAYVTASKSRAETARKLASQAREKAIHYQHNIVGYNYRMSNVLAALGRAQLARLDQMISRRQYFRDRYFEFFSSFDGLSLLSSDTSEENSWLTFVRIDSERVDWSWHNLHEFMAERDVETRPMWKPMHMQPVNRDFIFEGGRTAEHLFSEHLALPSGSAMSDQDFEFVIRAVSDFLQRQRL